MVWNQFNKALKKHPTDNSMKICSNNVNVCDPQIIAELFKNHFTVNINCNQNRNCAGLPNIPSTSHNFFLFPTDKNEVKKIISNLSNKYSIGIDGVPAPVIKAVGDVISTPLADVINECLSSGTFPNNLKLAKIIPIHKKGNKQLVQNYRPISLLSVFSKIYERVIYNRLIQYLSKNNLISTHQYGFLPGKSTTAAICDSLNSIINNLDSKMLVAGMYFDLSKAFDLIDHNILIEKLEKIGVRGIALELFKSYLSDRTQRIAVSSTINNITTETLSASCKVTSGVPQGSILGPLLFLVFVNDLRYSMDTNSFYQFADDTSCIIYNTSISELSGKLSQVAENMLKWCSANNLVLNVGKTGLVSFKHFNNKSLLVRMNERSVEQVENIKFLGVTIDTNLTWHSQTNHVISKLNSCCCAIRFLRGSFNLQSLRIFYFSYIQGFLQYSIMFWYHSQYTNKVFISQKRIIRTMLGLHPQTSCRTHFKKLGIMTLTSLYIYCVALFTRKNFSVFTKNNDIYTSMCTRGGSHLRVPKHSTLLYKKGPYYNCVNIYNALPDDIKSQKTLHTFKIKLRQFLTTENSFYNLNEYLSK